MKLIIQIPCLNEEKTLPFTLKELPRKVEGIDEVEVLVIDDGSTDRTSEVAREMGVEHILRLKKNKGLARAFMAGIDACLKLGADIIVNTDGDNQYKGEDIPRLIKPILEGRADIVIGNRNIDAIPHFSPIKKKLQKLGSWLVRQLSETKVPDTTSGFRAYSREAALRLTIVSPYTYTLENIIQAGKRHMVIENIFVETNEELRRSRLISSIPKYLERSLTTIVRMYTMYQPLRVFFFVGGVAFLLGFTLGLRYLYFYFFTESAPGHLQSLMLSAVLLILSFHLFMMGLIGDIIASSRMLIEDTLYRIKKLELKVHGSDQ